MVKLCSNGDKYHFLSLAFSRSLPSLFLDYLLVLLLYFCFAFSFVAIILPFFLLGPFHYAIQTSKFLFPCRFSNSFQPLSSPTSSSCFWLSSLDSSHRESHRIETLRVQKLATKYKLKMRWMNEWVNKWKRRNDTNWWQLQTIASNYACYKPFYTFFKMKKEEEKTE